jgi:hypothetical protein
MGSNKGGVTMNKLKAILTSEVPFWLFAPVFFLTIILLSIDTDPVQPCNAAVGMKLTGPDGETILEFSIQESND